MAANTLYVLARTANKAAGAQPLSASKATIGPAIGAMPTSMVNASSATAIDTWQTGCVLEDTVTGLAGIGSGRPWVVYPAVLNRLYWAVKLKKEKTSPLLPNF